MISCTEFIPSYSELFKYLDAKYGYEEVKRFWTYLFKPDGKGIPLIHFAKQKGLRGCWEYWEGTLTEEAADCLKVMNEKEGWIYSEMYYCPSKGRLLELEKEIGLKPYYDYCGHCDYYRAALEKVGLMYFRNHLNVDKASCCSMIYNPKTFNGVMTKDEGVEYLRIVPEQQEYFHRDFHSSLNMGIEYVGKEHGEEALVSYLTRYTLNVYKKVIAKMQTDPLQALEDQIRDTYKLEKAEDALTIVNDGNTLAVSVSYCPAVKHLRSTGREVSKYFRYSTEIVMRTLAIQGGLAFEMEAYEEESGAAKYCFRMNKGEIV